MFDAFAFLQACGPFYVLTVDGGRPCGRPFGAVMEGEGTLYLATSPDKNVYRQILENENIQILALRPGTREWIRISGAASPCWDLAVKAHMLETCPVLRKHYYAPEDKNFAVLQVKNLELDVHV